MFGYTAKKQPSSDAKAFSCCASECASSRNDGLITADTAVAVSVFSVIAAIICIVAEIHVVVCILSILISVRLLSVLVRRLQPIPIMPCKQN